MKILAILIILLIGLSSCNIYNSPTGSSTLVMGYPDTTSAGRTPGYPSPPSSPTDNNPPEENEYLNPVTSTPAVGKGIVTGIILLKGEPVKHVNIFLAGFIKDSSGKDAVAFVSPGKSPEATTDESGIFVFTDVPIGNYGIVMENITDTFILMMPDGANGLLAVVENQRTTDMGVLDYNNLPLQR